MGRPGFVLLRSGRPKPGSVRRMLGEHIDFASEPGPSRSDEPKARRFVGVHFACCDVYSRVYINRDQTAYEGNCPKCAKRVRLRIGPGGTNARFFTAG